jgi:hypothetical protein
MTYTSNGFGMRDFGYAARGQAVIDAQAEVHAACGAVVDPRDESDPRTQRWLKAIEAFHLTCEQAYPETLRQFDKGHLPVSEVDTGDILDFLEADPVFYRSGYVKQKLLKDLKRRKLEASEIARIQAIILGIVCQPDHRREFTDYCKVAVAVADEDFRKRLQKLASGRETRIATRAGWMLAAIDGDWIQLKRALRTASIKFWQAKQLPAD